MDDGWFPYDVYCGVPTVRNAEIDAFLAQIPPDYSARQEDDPRDASGALGVLERLRNDGEWPALYWGAPAESRQSSWTYSIYSLDDGGFCFGVGVCEAAAPRTRAWLAKRFPRGIVIACPEQPPPCSFSEFEDSSVTATNASPVETE